MDHYHWPVECRVSIGSLQVVGGAWIAGYGSHDSRWPAGRCKGIECNIWERAKRRKEITHSFSGGGKENIGYAALKWQTILHGNAPGLGSVRELTVLPDKTAKFLFEYHGHLFQSLNLPHLPSDHSEINVHGMLGTGHVSAAVHAAQ